MDSQIAGFTRRRIDTGDVTLSVHSAGRGPALILLHGFPQTHLTWAKVAPTMAEQFQVIVPDLRGYGDSDAPPDTATHEAYSKRRMGLDIVGLMDRLGIARADVLGHDRGARVAYRMALDHPDRMRRLGIVEIVPTGDFWRSWTADLALAAYHWTFLAQPSPLPERMIGADPVAYIDHTLQSWTASRSLAPFTPEALESYRRQAQEPARIAAMCADYRAGATFDRALDEADRARGAKIAAPLSYLYAESGFPAQTGDPAGLWRPWSDDLRTTACSSGHFVIEENPKAVLDTFVPFFSAPTDPPP